MDSHESRTHSKFTAMQDAAEMYWHDEYVGLIDDQVSFKGFIRLDQLIISKLEFSEINAEEIATLVITENSYCKTCFNSSIHTLALKTGGLKLTFENKKVVEIWCSLKRDGGKPCTSTDII